MSSTSQGTDHPVLRLCEAGRAGPYPIPTARAREGTPLGLKPSGVGAMPSLSASRQAPASPAFPSSAPSGGGLAALHPPYFVQELNVGSELAHRPRVEVLRQLCRGRRVLHVGCADWPITDVQASIHLQLEPVCAILDGFDVHPEAFTLLGPHVRGRLFSRWEDVTDAYDLILVPEVLEHVPNVQQFLQQIDTVNAVSIALTVPDAAQCAPRHFEYSSQGERFVEIVHPDHNCWYSPYTLAKVLRKYTDWSLEGMWFFNRISLLVILTKRVRLSKEEGSDQTP